MTNRDRQGNGDCDGRIRTLEHRPAGGCRQCSRVWSRVQGQLRHPGGVPSRRSRSVNLAANGASSPKHLCQAHARRKEVGSARQRQHGGQERVQAALKALDAAFRQGGSRAQLLMEHSRCSVGAGWLHTLRHCCMLQQGLGAGMVGGRASMRTHGSTAGAACDHPWPLRSPPLEVVWHCSNVAAQGLQGLQPSVCLDIVLQAARAEGRAGLLVCGRTPGPQSKPLLCVGPGPRKKKH